MNVFEEEVHWCDRIISGEGFRIGPASIEGVKDMVMPETVDELCQFIRCYR